jgi:hypothetical protein
MPRLIRRTKVISIRLSHEEYDQFQELCAVRGSDTISALARTAMKLLALNENGNGKAAIESRVNAMDARVSQLDREVAHLSELMGIARLESNNGHQ